MPSTTPFALVVSAMRELGAYVTTAVTPAPTGTTLVVPGLKNRAYDAERYRFWYVARNDMSQWRLITSTTVPADGGIVVATAFDPQPLDGEMLHFFMVLDPDTLLACVGTALQDRFLPARATVPIVAEQMEYQLPAEISTWGQVTRVLVRDVSLGATQPAEEELTILRREETGGSCSMIVSPVDGTDQVLVVEYRRYYDAPTTWTEAITALSQRLLVVSVKHAILQQIFQTLGAGAKRLYGQAMVLTERAKAEEEARWQWQNVKRSWQTEEDRLAGFGGLGLHRWGW